MGSKPAAPPRSGESDPPGLKIINAALFRMGTKSMALAYQILGYRTHHGLLEDVTDSPWTQLEQAAEATWPSVPGGPRPPRPPFRRADWDALWGDRYDAVTDLASPFAIELIRAYPDAKVVVVQRDFDTWWPSFRAEVLDRVMRQPAAAVHDWLTRRVMGVRAVQAMRKIHFGFFGARSREEVYRNARGAYDAYFAEVRRAVPEGRRLEYRMGDGWEPLCAFLGVPVPDVPFPGANEQEAHRQEVRKMLGKMYGRALRMFAPLAVGVAAIAAGWLWYQRA